MLTINSLLAGFSFSRVGAPSGQSPVFAKGQPKTERIDTFTWGQQWLNKAKDRNQHTSKISGKAPGGDGLAVAGGLPDKPENGSILPDRKTENSVSGENTGSFSPGESEKNSPSEDGLEGQSLSGGERQYLDQLQAADREVKAHEMAHLAAAGSYARGGASYQYKQGPDGKKYAVGGEVSIDIGKESTPEKTIEKMRVVRRAALAPADPSPQDQRVAARATLSIAESVQELRIRAADGEGILEKAAGNVGGLGDEKKGMGPGSARNASNPTGPGVGQGGPAQLSSLYTSLYQSSGLSRKLSGIDLFA